MKEKFKNLFIDVFAVAFFIYILGVFITGFIYFFKEWDEDGFFEALFTYKLNAFIWPSTLFFG